VTRRFSLTVNDRAVEVESHPDTPLLSVLRNDLDLPGSRFGCGVGLCGACFVMVDGTAVPSCDTPMWAADGTTVVTVEGLGDQDGLHPVQQAILDGQAAQCGFCISGIAVSAAALLRRNPAPDEDAVVEALDRNLCRCGVQRRVVDAVLRAGSAADPATAEGVPS
jgi:nicotinate dehydrogenase subunit A